MRLSTAAAIVTLGAPGFSRAFHVVGRPSVTHTSTSLAARRTMFPILRRSDLFFPDVDRMFDEMDEMMESSLATRFTRPSLSLLGKGIPDELKFRRPLGFKVTQDEKEYKVAVHVPDVEVKDMELKLDNDGRVLRLKGDRSHEEGGMKVRSRFEKAILLSPEIDTTKLTANMSGNTLTVVAPKIEKKLALDKAENKKVEIKVVESKATPDVKKEPLDDTQEKAPTRLAVENMKEEKVEVGDSVEGEKKWPVRDFPY